MAPRGTRQNTVTAASARAGQARREDPRPRSAALARSSAGRRVPAARLGSLRVVQYAGGGTGSPRPRGGFGGTRRNRSGSAHTTPLRVTAVAAPPCSRRSGRPPCADPSPAPAMTLGGRPLAAPGHSTRQLPQSHARMRRAAMADRNHGKARNGGPESGICTHSAFRSSPVRPSPAVRLLVGQAGRGTPRLAIPLDSGMRCREDSH